ncbi:hypothetical protein [Polaribacter porphyrae]|uniref:O-antigen polymerase n=1 Tax=Polaribacter porphyrae TaxID=1137780 RepID=A0A2S7WS49_9FLAO|nr:hypothetical protein [Polaribacter porphyrae]PQJ80414.1 hypothetical protein BTO18_15090 [Polaribacter porphyrae]
MLILSFFAQRVISSIEVNTIILSLFAFFLILINKGKFFKQDFELLFLPILLIVIGVFTAVFNKPDTYDLIRDLIYFSKPVILILTGYFVARSIVDWKTIFKTIIYLGVFYAVYHISHTIIFTDYSNLSVSSIRNTNGLSNIVIIFAIALLILSRRITYFKLFSKSKTNSLLFILSISFILYFSRTMFLGLLFLILGFLNYLKLNKKGLKYLTLLIIFFSSLYIYLFNANISRKGGTLETFLYKLKVAPSEIFSPKLNLKNHAQLWDHWRAYEAYCAIQGLNEKPSTYINGKGFGALVDLKFPAPLSKEGNIRYIPILHNGYVYILYKTGILGLLTYLYFLFFLYYQSYIKTKSIKVRTFRNLVSATAVYLIFSSLIIVGLYNPDEEIALFLGIFLYLKSNAIKKI